jgi:hypothetical protein
VFKRLWWFGEDEAARPPPTLSLSSHGFKAYGFPDRLRIPVEGDRTRPVDYDGRQVGGCSERVDEGVRKCSRTDCAVPEADKYAGDEEGSLKWGI